jgi:hypothetical protein
MSDQNFILDALVFSSINNIISETQFRNKNADYWTAFKENANEGQTTANQLDPNTTKLDGYINFRNNLSISETNPDQLFADLLSQTTIKRACCLGYNSDNDVNNFEISVKIPFVEELSRQSGATQSTIETWRKLGYISKIVKIPKSMCPTGYSRPDNKSGETGECDKFMRAYCENAKEMYDLDIKDISGTYSENEFMNIAPECGCFADRLKEYGGQAPALCYSPRCNFSQSVYVDQNSRKQGGCPVNQCVAILNLSTTAALGGVTTGVSGIADQSCFSPKTQKEHGFPSVESPTGLTPPPPPGGTPPAGTPPAGTPPRGTPPPAGTPPAGTPPAGTPTQQSSSSSNDTIVSGLSNTAFYGIIGGIGGLVLIIIIVIIVLMGRKNKTSSRLRLRK